MSEREDDGTLPTLPRMSGDAGLPQIAGYKIVEKISEGGMGTVWRATHLTTRREVALKLIRPEILDSDQARVRFEREVRLAASLEHPNIACVYDANLGTDCYYTMQLIRGVHLDVFVEKHRLAQRAILELMRAVCWAVYFAHQRGIIHRDLKPSNVLVTAHGQPVILDFGLAKSFLLGSSEPEITIRGQIAGTPAFMAPEQKLGLNDRIDFRADVYSLGVILFCLLTGLSPHALSGLHVSLPGSPGPMLPGKPLDHRMVAILTRALAYEPAMRFGSAGEMAVEIDKYLATESPAAPPGRHPSSAFGGFAPGAAPKRAAIPQESSRNTVRNTRIIAALVILACALLIMLLPQVFKDPIPPTVPDPPSPTTPPPPTTPEALRIKVQASWEEAQDYIAKGDTANAMRALTEVIRLDPSHTDAYLNRGHIYLQQGENAKAIEDFTGAIRSSPNSGNVRFIRGQAFWIGKDYVRAAADFSRAIELEPQSAEPYNWRSQAYLKTKEFAKAVPDATKVIELDTESAFGYGVRGQAYVEMGQHQLGVRDLTEAIKRDPDDADWYYFRSRAYRQLGQSEKADADRQQARQLNPNVGSSP